MSHIYIITNIINGKQYVGYTSHDNIKDRYNRHWSEARYNGWDDPSPFHLALLSYGNRDVFQIEDLYEFNEELEDWVTLEQKYINEYNTLIPNGYNLLPGGNKPPIHYGNDNYKTKYPDELLPELYEMLANPKIRYETIAQKTGLTVDYLYEINQGKFRYNPNIQYPIRKYDVFQLRALGVIEILATDVTLSNNKIAEKFGIRPNEVASINQGRLYHGLWTGEYPIRKVIVPDNYEEKQALAKKVLKYKEEHPELTYKQIQIDLNIKRGPFDKIIKNIYPYNVK